MLRRELFPLADELILQVQNVLGCEGWIGSFLHRLCQSIDLAIQEIRSIAQVLQLSQRTVLIGEVGEHLEQPAAGRLRRLDGIWTHFLKSPLNQGFGFLIGYLLLEGIGEHIGVVPVPLVDHPALPMLVEAESEEGHAQLACRTRSADRHKEKLTVAVGGFLHAVNGGCLIIEETDQPIMAHPVKKLLALGESELGAGTWSRGWCWSFM